MSLHPVFPDIIQDNHDARTAGEYQSMQNFDSQYHRFLALRTENLQKARFRVNQQSPTSHLLRKEPSMRDQHREMKISSDQTSAGI
jgi:hypothetical protein